MKQKVLFMGMWLGLISVGYTQSTLTLDECYRQAETHSPQAGQTRLIQEATELQLPQWASYLAVGCDKCANKVAQF
jgi:hypothetical protein